MTAPLTTATLEAFFKPTPGGWIYRSGGRFCAGGIKHLLLTDEQKAAIIKASTPSRLDIAGFLIALFGVPFAFVVLVMISLGIENPTPVQAVLIFVAATVIMFGILIGYGMLKSRRVTPLLADLPLSPVQITTADIKSALMDAQPKAQSYRTLLRNCMLCAFACIINIGCAFLILSNHHFELTGNVTLTMITAATMGVLTCKNYRMILRKAGER